MSRNAPAARMIEVAFPYDASVIFKGFRKPETAQFLSRTAVAVREVGSEELIPALEITDSYARHMQVDFGRPVEVDFKNPEGTVVYAFEGALWAEFTDHHGRPVSPDLLIAGTQPRDQRHYDYPFDLNLPVLNVADQAFRPFIVDSTTDFPEITIDQVQLRSVLSTRAEAAAVDAQRVADSLLIVDGKVMYRCHEPFWSAHPHRGTAACLVFGPEDVFDDHVRIETFRADRREDLLAWRQRWAETDGGSPALTQIYGSLRILSEGHLHRDDLKYACRGMEHIAEISFPFFREADASTLLHWIALRDLARGLKAEWSRDAAMSAMDALAGLRDAFVNLPVRGHDYSRNAFEITHRACRRILARAHWFEGWSNSAGVELSVDDAAAIESLDDWKLGGA